MLSNKKGGETRIDFAGGLGAGRVGKGRDQFGGGIEEILGEMTGTGRHFWVKVEIYAKGTPWYLPG